VRGAGLNSFIVIPKDSPLEGGISDKTQYRINCKKPKIDLCIKLTYRSFPQSIPLFRRLQAIMVSFDTIRNQFKTQLAKKPLGLTVDELFGIIAMCCRVSTDDEPLFMRFEHWIRHKQHSEKIVCANVELVRFGVLAARESRKNSGATIRPSFAKPNDIDRFLQRIYVEPKSVARRADTVEARAKIVDDWVNESIDSKDRIELPPIEDIQPESNIGNNRPTDMKYISVEQLVKCIAHSENASSLKEYAMNLMALLKIYQEELIVAKDNAIQIKDDKIAELKEMLELAEKRAEERALQQQASFDKLMGIASDTKAQNEVLIDTTDRMEKRQISMAKDINTMIGLFNNIGFTPNVVKQIIELHGGVNNNGAFRIDSDRPWEYVDSCKLFFMSSWYNESTRRLTMRVAARNFKTVSTYYKSIEAEVQNEARHLNHTLVYRGTQVIALCDQDVNAELSTFDPVMRRHGARKVGGKVKKFEAIALPSEAVETYISELTTDLRNVFCMRHQTGIRKLLEDTTFDDDQRNQIIAVRDQHTTFNTTAIEWCQMYVSSCIEHLRNGMRFTDRRLTFPKMTGLPKTHQVDGTDWRLMTPLQYAMTMFKICVRDFSRNEYIREIIHNDMTSTEAQ
jgi:hypothetical protein